MDQIDYNTILAYYLDLALFPAIHTVEFLIAYSKNKGGQFDHVNDVIVYLVALRVWPVRLDSLSIFVH